MTNHPSTTRSGKLAQVLAGSIAALLALTAPSAQSAVYYWDPSGGGSFGGITGTDYWIPNRSLIWTGSTTGNTSRLNLITTTTADDINFGGTAALGGGTIPVGFVDARTISYSFASTGAVVLSGGVINLAATTSITANTTAAHTISSSITGASTSLTKAGTSTVILSGSNTFTGSTIISAGILTLGNSLALQNSALNATTSITGDASNGLRTTVTTLTLGGLAGTKDLAALFTTTSGGFSGVTALTLNPGAGTSSYSGVIANGASGMTLAKTGQGTQVLSGANTFTGATTVSAGTLTLDYGTQDNSKLADAAALVLGSGTINLTGGTHTEVVASTTLTGAASVTGTAATAKLAMNAITGAGTVNFGADNIATTTNANDASGILGGWATVGGANWARNDGSDNIVAYTAGYTDVDALGSTIADGVSTNVRIFNDGAGSNIELGSTTTTINTLLQGNAVTAATINTATKTLAVSGVMLGSGAESLTIGAAAGDGTLQTAAGGGTLVLNNFNAAKTLTVNAAILDNTASGLTKGGGGAVILAGANTYTGATVVGGGTLSLTGSLTGSSITVGGNAVLSQSSTGSIAGAVTFTHASSGTSTLLGANSYTGATTISSGVLNIQNGSALGTTAAGTSVSSESALQLQGGIAVGNESLALTGTGVSNTGSLRSISGSNTWGGLITLNSAVRINADAGLLTLDVASGNAITATNQALVFGGAGNITVADPIATGSGALQKDGAGTLTLAGTNTYTGITVITAGAVNVQNASALGTTAQGTVVGSGSALQIQGGISVAEALTFGSTGVSTTGGLRNISGNNTWSGTVTFVASGRFNSDAGTLTISSNLVSNGVAFTSPTISFGGAGNVTLSGNITTTNGVLVKDGNGTLTLTGANTYINSTTIAAGTLNANSTSALGNGSATNTLIFTGGTLQAGGTITSPSTRGVTLTSTGLINTNSNAVSIAGIMGGAGGLTKSGAGTLTLSGANTYGGVTTVNAGTLTLDYSTQDNSKVSNSTALVLGGGTLVLSGGTHTEIVASTTLTAGTASSVTRSSGSSVFQMGAITRNTGAWIDFGISSIATTDSTNTNGILGVWATVAGSDWAMNSTDLALGPVTAYTGYTDVTRLTPGTITDAAATNVRLVEGSGAAGSILLGAATTTVNSVNQSASGGTSDATIDPVGQTLSTNGILVGTGAGGLTIGTGVNNGTLMTTTAGGELMLISNTANGLTINSVVADNTISSLTKMGTSTVTLTGVNTYAGATTIGTGTLNANTTDALGDSSATNTLIFTGGTLQAGGTITSAATRLVTLTSTGQIDTNGNAVSIAGIMSGAGGLNKSGAGTLTLTGVNTYTGSTTIGAGTLNANATDALGSGVATNTLVFTGGTLQAGGTITSPSTRLVTLTSTGAIDTNGNPVSIAGIMSGAGGVTKSGANTLTLTGVNTYTGGTTINAGNLAVSGGSAIVNAGLITLADVAGATFQVVGSETIGALIGGGATGGAVSIDAAQTLSLSSGTQTYAGTVSGAGTLTNAGAIQTLNGALSHSGGVSVTTGTLTLGSSSSTYTGTTAISAAAAGIIVTANGALGATGIGNETTVGANGVLGFSGGITYSALEKITGSGAGNAASGTPVGFAIGSRGFIQSVSGSNTFAGDIEVTAASRIGTQDGAQLTLTGVITQTVGNILFRVGNNAGDFVTLSNAGNSFGGDSTVFTGATVGNYAGVRLGITNGLPTNLTISGFSGTGAGAALDLNGKDQTLNGLITGAAAMSIINMDTVNASTLTLNPTTNLASSNTLILGGGGLGVINLVKDGASTQTLSGTNTFTGTTTVSAGTLALSGTAILPDTTAVNVNNAAGTFNISAVTTSETIGSLAGVAGSNVVLGAKNLTVGDTSTTTFGGTITGTLTTGTLVKQGTGVLNLAPGAVLSFDTLTANGGTLNVNSALGTGPGTGVVAVNGATTKLRFGSVSQTLNSLTIGAGSTVIFTSGTASGAFSGGGDKGASLSGSAVVPEPGTIGLLLVGALGVLNRRRRQA